MKNTNLVRFAILGDPVTHFAESAFPNITLCGADTGHGLVRTGGPSTTAAALGVPKEFLYGRDEEDGADDR